LRAETEQTLPVVAAAALVLSVAMPLRATAATAALAYSHLYEAQVESISAAVAAAAPQKVQQTLIQLSEAAARAAVVPGPEDL
jgi:hypothetical protein